MSRLVGTWGVTFIIATVMLSTFGALNAGMLSVPRVYYAMSEDRLFFEPLARVHPRYRTPHVAVLLTGGMSVLYVLVATLMQGSKAFSALIDACVVGNIPFYALAVGSIFIFRRRERKRKAEPDAALEDALVDPAKPGQPAVHPHPYAPPVHALFYPVTPILFIASTLLLLGNSLLDSRSRIPSLIVLGMLAAGAPLYYATIGRKLRA
jgi:amino acid transporter